MLGRTDTTQSLPHIFPGAILLPGCNVAICWTYRITVIFSGAGDIVTAFLKAVPPVVTKIICLTSKLNGLQLGPTAILVILILVLIIWDSLRTYHYFMLTTAGRKKKQLHWQNIILYQGFLASFRTPFITGLIIS